MKLLMSGEVGTHRGLIRMSAVVESTEKPDAHEVARLAGYHPAGYGCYDATVEREPDLVDGWRVLWSRGTTCD